MIRYIVRTSRGDVPVESGAGQMTDKELLAAARNILKAARARGLSGRIIKQDTRRNPDPLAGTKLEPLGTIRAVPQILEVLRSRLPGTTYEPVARQSYITGMDLAKGNDQVELVVDVTGNAQVRPGRRVVKYTTPTQVGNAIGLFVYASKKKKAIIGIYADPLPSGTPLPAWLQGLDQALVTASRVAATGRSEVEPVSREAERKVEPARVEVPSILGGELEPVDILKGSSKEVVEQRRVVKEALESLAEEKLNELSEQLGERGYELVMVPYSAELFQYGQATPGADVLVGFFYPQTYRRASRTGVVDAQTMDPIAKVISEARPRPNVISYPFDPKLGEPRMEGVKTVGLLIPFNRDPRWLRDVEQNLVRLVDEWASREGGAAGLVVRRQEAGADFYAPISGRIEEFKLKNVATPKVVISTEASLSDVEPYTKHIQKLQEVANAYRMMAAEPDNRDHYKLTREAERLLTQQMQEKARLTEINAMPAGPKRVLATLAQYVDGLTTHILILEQVVSAAKDAFNRAKYQGRQNEVTRIRAGIVRDEAEIQKLREKLSTLPRNLGSGSSMQDRLRAIKALYAPSEPNVEFKGDERSGIYRYETFTVPEGATPVVALGEEVSKGDLILKGAEEEEVFTADVASQNSALLPSPGDKKKRRPAFAVVAVARQLNPTSRSPIIGAVSAPIPVPKPEGFERAYSILLAQLQADPAQGIIPELAEDDTLLDLFRSLAARAPASGQGTERYAKQLEVLARSAANLYVDLIARDRLADAVNQFVAPHYDDYLPKLERVYRIYGEAPEPVKPAKGEKKPKFSETFPYAQALEDWEGADWVQRVNREVEEAMDQDASSYEFAQTIARQNLLKDVLDPTNPPPIPPSVLEKATEDVQRSILVKRFTPRLVKDPVLYYTITFFDGDGKVLWEGSVPHMKIEPPEGVELVDLDTGRPERLVPIASMFPLSSRRVSGVLRRSGYSPLGGYELGSAERFVAMRRANEMEYIPADRSSPGRKEAEFRSSMLTQTMGYAAEARIAAGLADVVREADVRITYGGEGSMAGEAKPFVVGGRGFGGTKGYGRYGVLVSGVVPASEQERTVAVVTQKEMPKSRQDEMISRITRTYGKLYEPRRDTDLPRGDWKSDEAKYLKSYVARHPMQEAKGLVRQAATADWAALAEEARRIKGGATLSDESSMLDDLEQLSRIKDNPMRDLLRNPRYLQLVKRTGRVFGKPVRRNAGEDNPFGMFGSERVGAEEEEVEQVEAPKPEKAPSRRRSTQTPAVKSAPKGAAAIPLSPAPAVESASDLSDRVAAEHAKTQSAFASFFDLLITPRSSTENLESAFQKYLSALEALRNARQLNFRSVESQFGPDDVQKIKEAEAQMDLARSTAPILRAPGRENEQFRAETRAALAKQTAHEVRADGMPLYDISGLLTRRSLAPIPPDMSELVFRRTTILPSAQSMIDAARAQGSLVRQRPPSTASAFERAERASTGRSLSMYDYNAPDKVMLMRTPGVQKSIVLWMSPKGDHIIRYVGPARTAQFHRAGSVGPDGKFYGESWVDVLAKAFTHQTLFMQDEAMKGRAGKWEVWVGKSGSPALYRIHDANARTSFTVKAGFDRLARLGRNVSEEGDPLSFLRDAPADLTKAIRNWTEPSRSAPMAKPEEWPGVEEDVVQYEAALAKTFSNETVSPTEGLKLLRAASRVEYEAEKQAATSAEMGEATPAPFFFVPPGIYTKDGELARTKGEPIGSDAGEVMRTAMAGAVDLARAGGVPLRIYDCNLFGRNDELVQATLNPGKDNRLELRANMRGGRVVADRFPSPLLTAIALATEDPSRDVAIELFVPKGRQYEDQLDRWMTAAQLGDNVSVKFVELSDANWAISLGQALVKRYSKFILLNLPDASDRTLFGGGKDDASKVRNVTEAITRHIGNISQVLLVTSTHTLLPAIRNLLADQLDRVVASRLKQGDTGASVPIAKFKKSSLALGDMGLKSDDVEIPEDPTREDVVEAIAAAVLKHSGLSSWDAFVEIYGQEMPMRGNPGRMRYNPFLRPNYGRRTRIDMASRYMRQVPWMWPTRD